MRGRKLLFLAMAGLIVSSFTLCAPSAETVTTTGGFSMPGSIGVYVPDNIYNESQLTLSKSPRLLSRAPGDSNVTGWAYNQLKEFTTAGVYATEMVDFILSNVLVYSNFFSANLGVLVTNVNSDGWWVFYNSQSGGGYYLYLGTNNGVTNLYIDWNATGSGFIGKAVYHVSVSDPQAEVDDALIYFNTSDSTLDIYFEPNTGIAWWEQMRLVIEQYTPDAVTIEAKGILTNAMTNSINNDSWEGALRNWDLLGYSSDTEDGGVTAWAETYLTDVPYFDEGSYTNDAYSVFGTIYATNTTLTEPEIIHIVTNELVIIDDYVYELDFTAEYAYEEYFDTSGEVVWKMGIFTTDATNIISDYTNEVYTNNSKPAMAPTVLETLTELDVVAYPTITLP